MNFPLYTQAALHVMGLDPSPKLRSIATHSTNEPVPVVDVLEATAEALALDDRSIDTVVSTWTLCSIPHVERAPAEVPRLLRLNGHSSSWNRDWPISRAFAVGNIV